MRKLRTVQTQQKLNDVYSVDDRGKGGAHHRYVICRHNTTEVILEVGLQNGARMEKGSIDGVLDSDLLEIVRDRLTDFQKGEYPSEHNQQALEYVNKALECLNNRVKDRISRGVLGNNTK